MRQNAALRQSLPPRSQRRHADKYDWASASAGTITKSWWPLPSVISCAVCPWSLQVTRQRRLCARMARGHGDVGGGTRPRQAASGLGRCWARKEVKAFSDLDGLLTAAVRWLSRPDRPRHCRLACSRRIFCANRAPRCSDRARRGRPPL